MRTGAPRRLGPKGTTLPVLLLIVMIVPTLIIPGHSSGDNWSSKRPIPDPRSNAGAAGLEGRVYVVGGIDISLNVLSDNIAYDPLTDQWSSMAPLPAPTESPGVVAADGHIYAIGGLSPSGLNTYSISAAVESYDPQNNSWATRTPIPRPTEGLLLASANGLIYAVGGYSARGNENSTWIYDPQNDTWESRAPIPAYATSLSQTPDQIAAVGGKIYVFDQSNGSLGPGVGVSNNPKPLFNLVYDTSTNTWSHWPAILTLGARGNPISLAGDSMVAVGAKVLVIGGNDIGLWCTGSCSTNPQPTPINPYNFEYDTVSGSWTRRSDMPTARVGLVTANVGGIVYAIGGTTSNIGAPLTTGFTNHNEAYTPCSGNCPPFNPGPLSNSLTWQVEGLAALIAVGGGLLVWRAWKRHQHRPRIRPLDPIDWRRDEAARAA